MNNLGEVFLVAMLSLCVCSVLSALLYPLWSRSLSVISPELSSQLVFLYGILPAFGMVFVVALMLNPDAIGILFYDHCHGTLCGPHVPDVEETHSGLALVTFSVILLTFLVGFIWLQFRRNRLKEAMLSQLATPVDSRIWSRIAGSSPTAFTAGLLTPHIYVSDGMVETLSETELSQVLAHEQSHVWHRDPLRRFVLKWMTLLWPRPFRRKLLSQHGLLCELRADQGALRLNGNRPQEFVRTLDKLIALRGLSAQCDYVQERRDRLVNPQSRNMFYAVLTLSGLLTIACAQIAAITYISHPLLDLISH
ncbi:M56 family metallopeptidase [uncultured Thalassolituus sp.]|uniref:M56 family metallopeptidase n=1 Tax=uncultured Thalassolituus sp. TaxID=285273 RepID=UPI002621C61B|nr:M56 family metallopeptidase [uncultured Thalassolituus sp.]